MVKNKSGLESDESSAVEHIVMTDLNNALPEPTPSTSREEPAIIAHSELGDGHSREIAVVEGGEGSKTSKANENSNMRNLGCWFYTKFIFSLIGLVLGLAIFVAFFFVYHNYNAALWGFASGVFAAGVVQLHILYLRGTLEEYHSRSSLTGILWFGFVGMIVSLGGMAIYLYLAISKRQEFEVKGNMYYPASTFCFLSFKWGAGLAWNARHYRRVLDHSNPALLSGVRVHPDSDTETLS